MTLPEGLHPLELGGARAFAAPEIEAWVRGVLGGGRRLHEAAAAAADLVLEGRADVPVVRTARGRWVVRRYHRGGLLAGPLLRDRYLRVGLARPLREASASRNASHRGIATPRVVAGAIYPAGAFYRADLVTEYVAGSGDLARVLFVDRSTGAERAQILGAVGGLIARAAAAGIVHADLNAKNVLIDSTVGGPTPLLLDLDRCRVLPPGVRGDPEPMLERLERSLRKHVTLTGKTLGESEWAALRRGAGGTR